MAPFEMVVGHIGVPRKRSHGRKRRWEDCI